MMRMVTLSLTMFVFLANHLLAEQKAMTVCEVLSKLDQYRGRMTKITGVVIGSRRHGSALYDYDKPKSPCPEVLKQGRKWPSAIYLVWPHEREVEDGPRVFKPDVEDIEKNLANAKRQMVERDDLLITATFLGELRSRKSLTIVQSDEGWYMGDGYGQGGQYPAQLVIKTVTKAKVIEARSWKRRKFEASEKE